MELPKYSFLNILKFDQEVMMDVLVHLQYPDLLRFSAVCRATKELCDNDYLWKLKVRKDFDVNYEYPQHSLWVADYKMNRVIYLEQKSKKLMRYVKAGNYSKVEELLNLGVNPNLKMFDSKDWTKYTALVSASRKGHAKIVELLLKRGADPNIPCDWGQTALIVASGRAGHFGIVKMLLEAKVDPNQQDKHEQTALTVVSGKS